MKQNVQWSLSGFYQFQLMHVQNLIKIHQLNHKILSINKILTLIKGHNTVES